MNTVVLGVDWECEYKCKCECKCDRMWEWWVYVAGLLQQHGLPTPRAALSGGGWYCMCRMPNEIMAWWGLNRCWNNRSHVIRRRGRGWWLLLLFNTVSICKYFQVHCGPMGTWELMGTWLMDLSHLVTETGVDPSMANRKLKTCGFRSRSPASALMLSLSSSIS